MRVSAGRLQCRCAMYSAGSNLRADRSPPPPKMIMSSGRSGEFWAVWVVIARLHHCKKSVRSEKTPGGRAFFANAYGATFSDCLHAAYALPCRAVRCRERCQPLLNASRATRQAARSQAAQPTVLNTTGVPAGTGGAKPAARTAAKPLQSGHATPALMKLPGL